MIENEIEILQMEDNKLVINCLSGWKERTQWNAEEVGETT